MLAALRIESLAIIDALEVRFDKGLNVLTGETGAGKSILVDALGLLLGGRADPASIRSGCEEAVVEGLFTGPGLGARAAELGLTADGDELLVRRTLSRNGRSRVHVNGALATVAILGALTRGLVDVSGQHEHVSLLRREKHLDLLDAHAGLGALRADFEASYEALSAAVRERDRLLREEADRRDKREWLEFQLAELDALAPVAGEDEALAEERRVLASTEKLRESARAVEAAIWSGDGAAADLLAGVVRRLEDAARVDGRLAPVLQLVTTAHAELEEAGRTLAAYGDALAGDPDRLAAIDERLEGLRRIARKHGGSLVAALARAEEMRAEVARLAGNDARAGALAGEVESHARRAAGLAKRLSASRRAAAGGFCAAVGEELSRLELGRAALSVSFLAPAGEGALEADGLRLSRRGAEEAEFLFCPNAGEEPRPLARSASGGELSRVLLALKRALAAADPVETYVFDEVDTGIGGAAALTVGRMLHEVARERQVLCVTHLPQVAAYADVHLHVSKQVETGRTRSRVQALDGIAERQRSLARMLAGSESRPAALAAAAELLQSARESAEPPAKRKRRRAA